MRALQKCQRPLSGVRRAGVHGGLHSDAPGAGEIAHAMPMIGFLVPRVRAYSPPHPGGKWGHRDATEEAQFAKGGGASGHCAPKHPLAPTPHATRERPSRKPVHPRLAAPLCAASSQEQRPLRASKADGHEFALSTVCAGCWSCALTPLRSRLSSLEALFFLRSKLSSLGALFRSQSSLPPAKPSAMLQQWRDQEQRQIEIKRK